MLAALGKHVFEPLTNSANGFIIADADAVRIERPDGSGPIMAIMRYTYAIDRRVSRTDTRTGLTEIMVGPRWQTLATYTAGVPTSTPREVFTYGD